MVWDMPPNAHGSSVSGPLTPPSFLELAWERDYLCGVQTNSPTDPPQPESRLRGVRRNKEVSGVVYPSTENTVKFPSKKCTDGLGLDARWPTSFKPGVPLAPQKRGPDGTPCISRRRVLDSPRAQPKA